MSNERRQSTKRIPLRVKQDPALWRYASLEEALGANCSLIATLIRAGEEQHQANEQIEHETSILSAAGD